MIVCPYCDAENIEAHDLCQSCEHSLADLHLPTPATDVERSLLKDRVRVLSPKAPIVVPPEMRVQDVLNLLVERSIGCVFVVKDEQLVGVFSERDALVRLNTEAAELADRPISDVMTTNPESLRVDSKIAFAVHRMDLGGYRHVPVVDSDSKVVGVISARDILRYLTEKMTALSQ